MGIDWTGVLIGFLFGTGLVISDLANPDKIIGTLKFKDFHALKVIVTFIVVSMVGVWILNLAGIAKFNVKPAIIIANLVGGCFLGVGFGLTGFCPGTGLAAAASGRFDALIAVLGMFTGALVYILVYPTVVMPLEKMLYYGDITLPGSTGIERGYWVLGIVIITLAGFLIVSKFIILKLKKQLDKSQELPEELE